VKDPPPPPIMPTSAMIDQTPDMENDFEGDDEDNDDDNLELEKA
jgi:hypothetical protein